MAVIEAIATTYLEADDALIEFTSIPQTYEHLQLRISVRDVTVAESIEMTIRLGTGGGAVDTGSNYYGDRMAGYKTTEVGGAGGARAYLKYVAQFASGADVPSPQYGAGVVDILDYASATKMTTAMGCGGTAVGASYPWVGLNSGLWSNTGAVDRIAISGYGYAANLVRGTCVTLYGLNSS